MNFYMYSEIILSIDWLIAWVIQRIYLAHFQI